MKKGTPEHPKTRALARALGLKLYGAVGLLECLWHFTGRFALRGDIGRHDDAAISEGCYWDGDPAVLVRALVACRWLDVDAEHRLVVHDWADHAERWVDMCLRRRNLNFVRTTLHDVRTLCAVRRTTAGLGIGIGIGALKEEGSGEEPTANGRQETGMTKPKRRHLDYSKAFETWWEVYPRRVGKADASKAYESAVSQGVSAEKLQTSVTLYAVAVRSWAEADQQQFVPYPATWINRGSYDDDPAAWKRTQNRSGPNASNQRNLVG